MNTFVMPGEREREKEGGKEGTEPDKELVGKKSEEVRSCGREEVCSRCAAVPRTPQEHKYSFECFFNGLKMRCSYLGCSLDTFKQK